MDTQGLLPPPAKQRRRRHSRQFKAQVVKASFEPGHSVAGRLPAMIRDILSLTLRAACGSPNLLEADLSPGFNPKPEVQQSLGVFIARRGVFARR